MSKPDYAQINKPSFTFGNNQDVHNQLINNLITDTTDPTNSNFLMTNAGTTQTINTNFIHNGSHVHNGTLSINDNNDDVDNTDIRLAKKRWVKNYYQTLDHTWSGADTFNNVTIDTLYCPNYVNFQSGSEVHLNTPLLIPNAAGGSNSLGTTKLGYLLNVSSDIQNQINSKQNTITDGSLTIARTSGLQSALDSKQNTITDGSLTIARTLGLQSALDAKQNTITDGSLTIARTTGLQTALDSKQNTITDGSLTISRTLNLQSSLNAKQNTIDSTHPINEDSVLNLTSDLTARPTLTQLQNGTLELAISKLTVDNIVATSQTISYQEMSIANNEIPQVKISNLVNDLGTITTNITNLSNTVSTKQNTINDGDLTISKTDGLQAALNTKANASDVTTSLATKQNAINDGDLTISKTYGLQTALDAKANASDVTTALITKQNTINDNDLTISKTYGLQTALDAKANASDVTSSLATKQNTLTTGSISDSMLASTFVKSNTAPILTGTNFSSIPQTAITGLSTSLQYLDATSSIQNQLNSKQATITNGSISDSMLASTFVKPSTAPILTGTNFSSIPTSAISSGSLTVTSLTCTSETDSGNATFGSISEKFTSIGNNGTTNSYTLDYTTNTAVYILTTAPTANFTVRLNNCGTDTTKSINFVVIYNTTGKYYANTITAYTDTSTQITLSSSTPLFLNGTPSITTSTVMIQSFSLVRNFASNYCLSSVASYY